MKVKNFRMLSLALLVIGIVIGGCAQQGEGTKTPQPTETQTQPTASPPTETPSIIYGREILRAELPPEKAIENFLPNLNYSWKLIKSDEGATLSTPSEIPRVPELAFKKNVTANIGGILATPLVENGKIFLADHGGVYALNESNGELIWGVEVYSDGLEGRELFWGTNNTFKWKALGYWRFVEAYGLGKYLFVGTSSSEEGDGYLLAFDKETGELVWQKRLESETNATSRSSVTSNLIVADGKVCVGSVRDEGYIFCYTEDGKFLWRNKIGANVRGLAFGDGLLFATSEPSKDVYAFDINSGKKVWKYTSDDMVSTPVYKDGKVLFLSGGDIVILNAYSGEFLKRIKAYGGADVNSNAFLGVGKFIYAPRDIGERPRELRIYNFEGNQTGEFKIQEDERALAPVITENMVLLPVTSENYAKIYFLWRGTAKLYDFKFEGEEIYMPKLSVANGKVYAIFSYDRSHYVLIKFNDSKKPEIKKVEVTKHNNSIDVKALIQDKNSGIYGALVAYRNGSEWHYVKMELARRYIMEPIGGYGFGEEEYIATIPALNYVITAIDNVGNYILVNKTAS